MRVSSFLLPLILSVSLLGCDAGSLDLNDPPDPAGPDAGQQVPAADASSAAGVLENRVQNPNALYHFAGGVAGQTLVADRSGAVPPNNLTIADPLAITWNLNSASIVAPTIITSLVPPTALRDACAASGAVTIEAWVRTGDLEQTGVISTFGEGDNNLNISLRQEGPNFATYLRNVANGLAGNPAVVKGPIDAVNMQHFVYSKELANGTVTSYLNNIPVPPNDVRLGSLGNWDGLVAQFAIGAEIGGENPWLGEIGLVAIYCKALSAAEVAQNFNAGY